MFKYSRYYLGSEMDLVWIGLGLTTLGCLIFSVFLTWRASKKTRIHLNELNDQLIQGLEDINTSLKPVKDASSRAMGAIGGLDASNKLDRALDRRIGQDLMGQNEDIIELISMAFPRVAEYIEERPEALTKILPRLNTLISDPETRKRLNLDLSGKRSDLSRVWEDDRR